MTVGQIADWLNQLAPFETAEDFDNVGLLLGDRSTDVHRVLFGMDVTEALVKEAIALGAELIVAHHPFIFHALKHIDYTEPQGRTLCLLLKHRIAVIAAHTNWDKAADGICDSLANALDLTGITSADAYVRVGTLPSPMRPDELTAFLRNRLHINARCYPATDEPITRIAVSGGAYGEGYLAAIAAGAQAYVVGEIAHHEILDACARGLTVFDAGHYPTELPGVRALYERFTAEAKQALWPVEAHLHMPAPYPGALLAFS